MKDLMLWGLGIILGLSLYFWAIFINTAQGVQYNENSCWMVVFEDGSAKFSWGHRPMMHVQVPQTKDYPGLNLISGGDVDGNIIDMTGAGGTPKVIRVPALDLRDKPDKYGNMITR